MIHCFKKFDVDCKICLQALTIAVVFHLLLGLLFIVPTYSKGKYSRRDQSTIMFSGKNFIDKQNILFWLEYGDPTLFVKPNDAVGFSSLGKKPKEAFIKTFYRFKENTFKPEILDANLKQLQLPSQDKHKLSSNWNCPWSELPSPPAGKKIEKEPMEYPCWLDAQGNSLPQLFDNLEALRKTVSQLSPETSTEMIIKLEAEDLLPRIRLSGSSGFEELDRFAMKALLGSYQKLKLSPVGESRKIQVKWHELGSVK